MNNKIFENINTLSRLDDYFRIKARQLNDEDLANLIAQNFQFLLRGLDWTIPNSNKIKARVKELLNE